MQSIYKIIQISVTKQSHWHYNRSLFSSSEMDRRFKKNVAYNIELISNKVATGGRYTKPNDMSMNGKPGEGMREMCRCACVCVYISVSNQRLCICVCGCGIYRNVFMNIYLFVILCLCVCFSPKNICSVSQLSDNQLQSAALTSKHTLSVHTERVLFL